MISIGTIQFTVDFEEDIGYDLLEKEINKFLELKDIDEDDVINIDVQKDNPIGAFYNIYTAKIIYKKQKFFRKYQRSEKKK